MKPITIISIVDILAFFCFILLTSSGTLMHYVLPPGSGRWSLVWGLNRHDWGTIHFWIAVIFLAVLSIHLVLHRSFITVLFKGHSGQGSKFRIALGLTGLIAIILLAIAPLVSDVDNRKGTEGKRRGTYFDLNTPGAVETHIRQGHADSGRHDEFATHLSFY